MVGTGPFTFTEWKPADHVLITKNPNYWNKAGIAHLDTVNVHARSPIRPRR